MEKRLLKTEDIRAEYGLPRDWILMLVRAGKLPNVGRPRRILVPRGAIERYLEAGGSSGVG